jgi:hypothetical protein
MLKGLNMPCRSQIHLCVLSTAVGVPAAAPTATHVFITTGLPATQKQKQLRRLLCNRLMIELHQMQLFQPVDSIGCWYSDTQYTTKYV